MWGWIFSKKALHEDKIRVSKFCSVQCKNKAALLNKKTSPQLIINNLLNNIHINYTNEYSIDFYLVDNYLDDYNLILEVNGDYYHSNPLIYSKINETQAKNVSKDKRKDKYIMKYHNIKTLYLWEYDINNNIKLCENIIL